MKDSGYLLCTSADCPEIEFIPVPETGGTGNAPELTVGERTIRFAAIGGVAVLKRV